MFERNNSQKVYSSILFAYLDVTLFPLDIWSIKHKLNVWIGKTNACQYHINKSFINLSLDNFLKNQISQLPYRVRLYLIWKIIHSSHKITKESYWSFNTTKHYLLRAICKIINFELVPLFKFWRRIWRL